MGPPYLADDCILTSSDKFRHRLRSADVDTCIVPRTCTRFGDRSFSAAGPGSGTAYRRNCDGQTLSLANSVDYWRHFCLFRDSRDGGTLVTVIMTPDTSCSYYYYYYYYYYYNIQSYLFILLVIFVFLQCSDTVGLGFRKGIRPVKSWMLVCWRWQFDWILWLQLLPPTPCSNNIQNGNILVPANPCPPGKWPLKRRKIQLYLCAL